MEIINRYQYISYRRINREYNTVCCHKRTRYGYERLEKCTKCVNNKGIENNGILCLTDIREIKGRTR